MSEFREGYAGEEEVGLSNAAETEVPASIKAALDILKSECAYINDDPDTADLFAGLIEKINESASNDPDAVEQLIDHTRKEIAAADGDSDKITDILSSAIEQVEDLS
jgi:DNA-binding ferritin-like protein